MASKLIFFSFAFASLATNTFAQFFTADYELSEEDLEPFISILGNQYTSVYGLYDTYPPIFDMIEKFEYLLIDGFEDPSEGNYTTISKALVGSKISFDFFLNSALIALGEEPCDAFEIARNSTYDDLEDAFASITEALKLAESGFPNSEHYYEYRANLEVYQYRTQAKFENVISTVFDSLRTCLATCDEAVLAEIQFAQDKSNLTYVETNNMIFNGMKVYAQEFAKGYSDVSVINTLEKYRPQAITIAQDLNAYEFSVLRAIYLSSKLNNTDISFAGLSRNQLALIGSSREGLDAFLKMFSTMSSLLDRVYLGLYDDGDISYSTTDAAQDVTAGRSKGAFEANIKFIEFLHPDSAEKISTGADRVLAIVEEKNSAYFGGIIAAFDSSLNLTESLSQIEAYRTIAMSYSSEQADYMYDLLLDGETLDEESEKKFASFQEAAPGLLDDIVNSVFNTTVILTEAVHASAEDMDNYQQLQSNLLDEFDVIDANYGVAVAAMYSFNLGLSEAGIVLLKANAA